MIISRRPDALETASLIDNLFDKILFTSSLKILSDAFSSGSAHVRAIIAELKKANKYGPNQRKISIDHHLSTRKIKFVNKL